MCVCLFVKKHECILCVFVKFNCVRPCECISVSKHRFTWPHGFIYSYRTFKCVCVQGFNNHVYSRGALECLSTQGATDMAWQVCVEDLVVCRTAAGSSTMCPFRPGRRQPRYRRTPVRRWGGRSVGCMSNFTVTTKKDIAITAPTQLMGCVTPCWVAVHWSVTHLGCREIFTQVR